MCSDVMVPRNETGSTVKVGTTITVRRTNSSAQPGHYEFFGMLYDQKPTHESEGADMTDLTGGGRAAFGNKEVPRRALQSCRRLNVLSSPPDDKT